LKQGLTALEAPLFFLRAVWFAAMLRLARCGAAELLVARHALQQRSAEGEAENFTATVVA
jgi:hypothetical protein